MTPAFIEHPGSGRAPGPEPSHHLKTVLLGISLLTMGSGLLQVVAPDMVLEQLAGSRTPTSKHLFATVGMFMVTAGGTLFSAVRHDDADPDLLRWAALQKIGASAAVAIGVRRHVFSRRALPVAGFDLATGLLCLRYRHRLPAGSIGGGR